jgi:Holliday junction resolvase
MSEADFSRISSGKKSKPKGPTETEIQNAIRDFLRWRGWFVIRHQQGLGCHKGLSDLTAIKNGRTVYIEVKNIFGKLSEKQIEFKSDIENHGGIYLVVRSIADIEDELARYHL